MLKRGLWRASGPVYMFGGPRSRAPLHSLFKFPPRAPQGEPLAALSSGDMQRGGHRQQSFASAAPSRFCVGGCGVPHPQGTIWSGVDWPLVDVPATQAARVAEKLMLRVQTGSVMHVGIRLSPAQPKSPPAPKIYAS